MFSLENLAWKEKRHHFPLSHLIIPCFPEAGNGDVRLTNSQTPPKYIANGNLLIDIAPIFLSKLWGLFEDEDDFDCCVEHEFVSSIDDDTPEVTAVEI